MKKRIFTVIALLILIILSIGIFLSYTIRVCVDRGSPPLRKDYSMSSQSIRLSGAGDIVLIDVDRDNKVDVISSDEMRSVPDFVAKGYETNSPQSRWGEMSNEMRKTASDVFKGMQELDYEMALLKYQIHSKKEKQTNTKEEKEVITTKKILTD